MSAWNVSDYHISLLVEAGLGLRWYWGHNQDEQTYRSAQLQLADPERRREVGQMLREENGRSMVARYDTDAARFDFATVYLREHLTPAKVFKAIHCYEYQSCEHPGWLASEAKAYCDAVAHHWQSKVEGYEEADWGFDEPKDDPQIISLTDLIPRKERRS